MCLECHVRSGEALQTPLMAHSRKSVSTNIGLFHAPLLRSLSPQSAAQFPFPSSASADAAADVPIVSLFDAGRISAPPP